MVSELLLKLAQTDTSPELGTQQQHFLVERNNDPYSSKGRQLLIQHQSKACIQNIFSIVCQELNSMLIYAKEHVRLVSRQV